MKTIKQIDLLKMMLKGGIQIERSADILIWNTKIKNNFDDKGVIVGTITENTFDMLWEEGIILLNVRTNRFELAIE